MRIFIESYKIKLLNSSPYYAQANGQAESSNKILIKLIKKKIEENPKRLYEVLSEALWTHRISRHGATEVTPFDLVYGQEVVCDNPGFRGKKKLFCFKNLNHDFKSKSIFVIFEKSKVLFTK